MKNTILPLMMTLIGVPFFEQCLKRFIFQKKWYNRAPKMQVTKAEIDAYLKKFRGWFLLHSMFQ